MAEPVADPLLGRELQLDYRLEIRARREGGWEVTFCGEQLPVEEVEIDDATLEQLRKRKRTVRG